MVKRPTEIGAFQFVVLSCLRATQLMAGCAPRVAGLHSPAVMAQMEVADGAIQALLDPQTDDRTR